jgi:hypothetical protein
MMWALGIALELASTLEMLYFVMWAMGKSLVRALEILRE